MATLQERIREYLGSQADTPAARSLADKAESMYAQELGAALGGPVGAGLGGAVNTMNALGEEGRDYVRSVIGQTRQGPGANVPRVPSAEAMPPMNPSMGTPMPTAPTPGGMAQGLPKIGQPAAPSNMGAMTPEELPNYFQSFEDAGINLTPGAGFARGLRGIDQAITNATTAPGNLGENQLQNIAGGNAYNAQGQINPYGLGLGQQMYTNPMGLLNY